MKTTLCWSTAASWLMALIYDKIEVMSGIEVRWLLVLSAVTLGVGLVVGLYGKDNSVSKEGVPVE